MEAVVDSRRSLRFSSRVLVSCSAFTLAMAPIIVLLFGRDTSIYTTAYKRYVIANEWFIPACHVTREQ